MVRKRTRTELELAEIKYQSLMEKGIGTTLRRIFSRKRGTSFISKKRNSTRK